MGSTQSDFPRSSPRVLRVIARLNVGGPARHVVWLTAGLKERGYETALVTGSVPPGEDDMVFFAASHGIEPMIIPEMSRELSLKDALTVWRLYRLFLRFRPDIVHTHTAKGGAVGRAAGLCYRWLTLSALWGRPRACRFVHTFHGHVFHSYFRPWVTRLFQNVERFLAWAITDRIVVISPQQLREIHGDFKVGRTEQFAVIPLGLDLDVFADWSRRRSRLRHEWSAGENDVLVGIVGRLTEIKNHELFLEAVAHFRARSATPSDRRVRFLIIGDGHRRAALEERARALGLHGDVSFLGLRNDPEYFYPALDIVALTSLNEGTPLTLIEAMANARPVVATGVGGVEDLLGKPRAGSAGDYSVRERGILVPSQNARAFCDALTCLVDDAPLRETMGKSGEDFILQNYSKQRLLDDVVRLYGEFRSQESGSPRASPRALGVSSQ